MIARARSSPAKVRYDELHALCVAAFGPPRQGGGSHAVFKTPWPGDPRVNIQRGAGGMAKAYQVSQVIAALDKLDAAETEAGGDD